MLEKLLEKVRKADKKVRDWCEENEVKVVIIGSIIVGGGLYWLCKSSKPDIKQIMIDSANETFGEGNYIYETADGKVHESIGDGCFAVWPNREAYEQAHKDNMWYNGKLIEESEKMLNNTVRYTKGS